VSGEKNRARERPARGPGVWGRAQKTVKKSGGSNRWATRGISTYREKQTGYEKREGSRQWSDIIVEAGKKKGIETAFEARFDENLEIEFIGLEGNSYNVGQKASRKSTG